MVSKRSGSVINKYLTTKNPKLLGKFSIWETYRMGLEMSEDKSTTPYSISSAKTSGVWYLKCNASESPLFCAHHQLSFLSVLFTHPPPYICQTNAIRNTNSCLSISTSYSPNANMSVDSWIFANGERQAAFILVIILQALFMLCRRQPRPSHILCTI